MYSAIRPSRSTHVDVRRLSYHVLEWGRPQPATPPLVLLHGWMDVGASYQFVVDAFAPAFVADRLIIAPDWRGFGLTATPEPCDHFVFADYLADLDRLLDHYAPGQAVDLVGHSMGGNVAMAYAGVRPARVRRLINLEGFGMPATQPEQAPKRYARWLDELRALEQGTLALKDYDSADGVAQRLMKTNRRLPPDKAAWLAQHWARETPQGRWELLGHPAHKVVSAQLYRVDETLALYADIAAPTLSVHASDDSMALWWKGEYTLAQYHERLRQVRQCKTAVVQDAGHMLHHDQPLVVARLIEDFVTADA